MTEKNNLGKTLMTVSKKGQREKLILVLDSLIDAGVSTECLGAYLSCFEHSPHNYKPSIPCFLCNEDIAAEQKRLSTVVNVLRTTYNASPEHIEAFLSRYAAREYLKTQIISTEGNKK